MLLGKPGNMEMSNFFKGKKIFVTGHTGFKGSWLCAVLEYLGADVTGYALKPNTNPNHIDLLQLRSSETIADINDGVQLLESIRKFAPDIVFHLAAQPLVRESYRAPLYTYQTNVLGTLNVLEAVRNCTNVKALVCITTDKVYENFETNRAYNEQDVLGGYDLYSSSKACAEVLIKSYTCSFLNTRDFGAKHNCLVATARAGNVVGGGDWSAERLLPDLVRNAALGVNTEIRSPKAVRPWQHVLDCLYGYLLLAQQLVEKNVQAAGAFNFAPNPAASKNVEEIIALAKENWSKVMVTYPNIENVGMHEAGLLMLDSTKAYKMLGWQPLWDVSTSIEQTIEWYKQFYENGKVITQSQIQAYFSMR